jgi:hypothetical protein
VPGRSPPGFSIFHDVGELCAGKGCGGVEVLPLLGGFPVCVSPASQENFYIKEHMLSASSL